MKSFDTLVEAINDLKARGYHHDFNVQEEVIECSHSGKRLSPHEFEITETYRFEGDSDPGDEMILYAIESKDGSKGTLVNAFGLYADSISSDLVKKLSFHK